MAARLVFSVLAIFFLWLSPAAGMDKEQDHATGHGMSQGGQAMTEEGHNGHDMDMGKPGHDVGMGESGHDMDMGEGHDHEKMVETAKTSEPDLAAQVRVDEQLGEFIDFSARFRDENNRPVDLKKIFDKPVVLLPVYFMCTSVCNFLQANLANVLNLTEDIPGKDYNIISVSFSDDEDHTHALTSKRNYANLIQREMDLDNWYYLTGDRENILKLTRSLGYYFMKQKKNFYIHPSVLMVLARDGKIIRYLYGPDFLPFDLGMALSEARKGEPGISIKRGVLSFCFDYDPENKTYVFKMFRITGTVILVLLAGFVLFLIRPSRSRKQRGRQHGPPKT